MKFLADVPWSIARWFQFLAVLRRLLAGSGQWQEMPKPVHVLDCLRNMDKKVSGVLSSCDSLSEIVHPNWLGVVGLYSRTDTLNFA
jgi:hypothetical protein